MENERTFKGQVNPLTFINAEFPSPSGPRSISAEGILSFLCPPGTLNDAQSLVERYKKISAGPTLHVAPAEPRILEKLVWPLRHAKASYVVGNNLARTIQCAVTRRHSSAGANPARQLSFQPVAVGADDGGNDIG